MGIEDHSMEMRAGRAILGNRHAPNQEIDMKRFIRNALYITAVFSSFYLFSGCALTTRLMVDMSSPVVSQMNDSFNKNCDIQIMQDSMPFTLAGISGLIDYSPNNNDFLLNGSHAYFGYAFAFVEDTDAKRASTMYLKARDYGLRIIFKDKVESILGKPLDEFESQIKKIKKNKVPALFWATISWLSYIRLNLDNTRVYLDIPKAEAMARRLLELDETYYFGSPCLVMAIFYSAQPEVSGGNPAKAKEYFEKAIELSQGKYLMHHLFFAKYYAVRKQDKDLYMNLLGYILNEPEDTLPDFCAVTNICKMKAETLMTRVDDYF